MILKAEARALLQEHSATKAEDSEAPKRPAFLQQLLPSEKLCCRALEPVAKKKIARAEALILAPGSALRLGPRSVSASELVLVWVSGSASVMASRSVSALPSAVVK